MSNCPWCGEPGGFHNACREQAKEDANYYDTTVEELIKGDL